MLGGTRSSALAHADSAMAGNTIIKSDSKWNRTRLVSLLVDLDSFMFQAEHGGDCIGHSRRQLHGYSARFLRDRQRFVAIGQKVSLGHFRLHFLQLELALRPIKNMDVELAGLRRAAPTERPFAL